MNRYYYEKSIGRPTPKVEKIGIGFPLMLGVLVLIIGPIVLFSTVNPIKAADPVTGGTLSVTFALLHRGDHTNSTLPLFSTHSVAQVKQISAE